MILSYTESKKDISFEYLLTFMGNYLRIWRWDLWYNALTRFAKRYPCSPMVNLLSCANLPIKFKLDWILGGLALIHTNTNVGKKSSADIGLSLRMESFNIWKIVFEHFTTQLILSCVDVFLSILNKATKNVNLFIISVMKF